MGPVVNQGHKEFVLNWIETAIKEGAKLILDGRNPKLPQGCEKGFFIGPTIFDHVTEEMSCGREEIFGPVLCIKRVDSFEEGLEIMNNSRFANGSVIYTESGHFAREFAKRTRRRHGRHQRRHSRSARRLRFHRTQAVVLWRPALHGPRRLHLLHRNQECDLNLVHRQGDSGQGQHLGRNHDARIRCQLQLLAVRETLIKSVCNESFETAWLQPCSQNGRVPAAAVILGCNAAMGPSNTPSKLSHGCVRHAVQPVILSGAGTCAFSWRALRSRDCVGARVDSIFLVGCRIAV